MDVLTREPVLAPRPPLGRRWLLALLCVLATARDRRRDLALAGGTAGR